MAVADLEALWGHLSQKPSVRLKRDLWKRLLGVAYGSDVGTDYLFLQHSYLVAVAKAVAWCAVVRTRPTSASGLLHGDEFQGYGLSGQNEPDFFDWMLANDGGHRLVMRIWAHVNRFDWTDLQVDVLKSLYESLIDPEARHDLGEYYTPDWLASRMVAETFVQPLSQRALDPACGSGTFLFQLVRTVLDAADSDGLGASEAVEKAAANVIGIDIHPVAVIFARVTYLLALLPALARGRPEHLHVPVFMGDALQWDVIESRPWGGGGTEALFSADETLQIVVPQVIVPDPKPHLLPEVRLEFPRNVASDAPLFDEVLSQMVTMGARSRSPEEFEGWMRRRESIPSAERDVLLTTYTQLRELHAEGRNHVWGYVARNLARPIWLSSNGQKVDLLIGNPPWVVYRSLSPSLQQMLRSEALKMGQWVGGKVATQQDLSAFFYSRAVQLYLRPTGRVAFLMPYAAMTRKAYAPFRKGEISGSRRQAVNLVFTSAWKFGPSVTPLFPVPSCVLFASVVSDSRPAVVPRTVTSYSGTLPRRNASSTEASAHLSTGVVPWPTDAGKGEQSAYRSRFRQGATLVPRRLILVERPLEAELVPPSPSHPAVRGRVGGLDKAPWNAVPPPKGRVEARFVRRVLLGESIAPFRILRSAEAVIPWDPERKTLMDGSAAGLGGWPDLAHWLSRAEALWEKHKRTPFALVDRTDYYGGLSSQFPLAPLRVVYTASGKYPAACVVRDAEAIVDHKLYWAAVASEGEGRYLCAVLNSEALRTRVRQFQSVGQWGPRDIHKYVFNLPIARFDDSNPLHVQLAEAGAASEQAANSLALDDQTYFVTARRWIRALLADDTVGRRMETLVHELLER